MVKPLDYYSGLMGSRIGLHGSMFGVVLEKDPSGAEILARTIAPVRPRKQS